MRTYQWAILFGLLAALVIWSLREHFEATASIKTPPFDEAEKLRIFDMLSFANQSTLMQQAETANPTLVQARATAQATFASTRTTAAGLAAMSAAQRTVAEKAAADAETALTAAKKAVTLKAAELITPAMETFFTAKYKPATVPITDADIKAYVDALPAETMNKSILQTILKIYFVGQSGVGTSVASGYAALLSSLGQTAGTLGAAGAPAAGTAASSTAASGGAASSTAASGATASGAAASGADIVDRICPAGTTLYNGVCKDTTATTPVCPTGYTLEAGLGIRCVKGSESAQPTCPSGKVLGDDATGGFGCISFPFQTASCPSGYTLQTGFGTQRCSRTGAASSAAGPPGGGSAMTSSGTAMAGNTTGGSSTSVFGPTAGGRAGGTAGGASKYMVWGPLGGGRAEGEEGVQPSDTSKTNKYPELMGGLGAGGDKTRIDGVGLTEPSSSWQLSMSGMLPDAKSLGTSELSKYLPFSRSPGDMDKVPDPYRVSQTFRTSSYSSKTEPVPFLSDFSAFQK